MVYWTISIALGGGNKEIFPKPCEVPVNRKNSARTCRKSLACRAQQGLM